MGDLNNKVISREYVEKNYIKKEDLLKWLEKEMQMCRDPENKVQMMPKDVVEGMIAAYSAIFYYIEGD